MTVTVEVALSLGAERLERAAELVATITDAQEELAVLLASGPCAAELAEIEAEAEPVRELPPAAVGAPPAGAGEVLAAFEADPEAWLSTGDVGRLCPVLSRDGLVKAIRALRGSGAIVTNGKERAGMRYRLAAPASAGPLEDRVLKVVAESPATVEELAQRLGAERPDLVVAIAHLERGGRVSRGGRRQGAIVYEGVHGVA